MPGPKKGASYKRAAERVSAVRLPGTCSKKQLAAYRQAAKRAGVPVSRWVRDVLDAEVGS